MNIQIDTDALVRNIQSRMGELENKRNLLHDRLAAVGAEIRSTEKEMTDIARTVCIKDYQLPPVTRGTLPVLMPSSNQHAAAGALGGRAKRPPEMVDRHRKAIIASLRGGQQKRLTDIHAYCTIQIGAENAGEITRTASMLKDYKLFTPVDRGIYRLSDKARAELDAQAS